MPPRYVYWTILIDGKPTAFRAHEKEELLPTFNQLRRTNKDVVFKWFARGRVWESPEAARAAAERPAPREKRPPTWRPGGEHADPRARFRKSRDERRRQFKQSAAPRGDHHEPGRAPNPAIGRANPRESRPWHPPPRAKGREGFEPRPPTNARPRDVPADRRGTPPPGPQPPRDSVPKPPAPPGPDAIKRDPPKRG